MYPVRDSKGDEGPEYHRSFPVDSTPHPPFPTSHPPCTRPSRYLLGVHETVGGMQEGGTWKGKSGRLGRTLRVGGGGYTRGRRNGCYRSDSPRRSGDVREPCALLPSVEMAEKCSNGRRRDTIKSEITRTTVIYQV